MKCELAAALLHRPKVLFLDEPTIGLDVTMQVAVREFIRRYNEQHGATVILTSHYMDDVAALCPRIIVIDHGRIVYDGALAELVRKLRPEKRVRAAQLVRAAPRARSSSCAARAWSSSRAARRCCRCRRSALQRAVGRAARASCRCVDLTVEDAPLEEVMGELFAEASAVKQLLHTLRALADAAARRLRRGASPTAPSSWSGCSPTPCRSSCWRCGPRWRARRPSAASASSEFAPTSSPRWWCGWSPAPGWSGR